MTEKDPTVVVTSNETLPAVIERVRGAASGGRTVQLVVPVDSALLLTASEFRALKGALDEERLPVVMRTADPLRLQLGERLGLRVQALPRPRAVTRAPAVPPPAPLPEPEREPIAPVEERAAPPADPASLWPVRDGLEPDGPALAEDLLAEEARGSPPSPANPPRRWLPLAALLILLVAAAFFGIQLVVPRAVIHVVPKSAPVSASLVFDVTADGQPLDDDAAFALPSATREIEVVWEGSAPVTGVRVEPDATAAGPIELRNASAEPLTVDAGTVVTTETGVEFAFVEAVTVPAADPATGEPGAATGSVRAVNPGSGGNVDTGEIGGRLPNGVYYSNRMEPTSGGTDKEFPVVAEADLEALSAAARDAAGELAAGALAQGNPESSLVVTSVTIADQQEVFDHQPGDDAEAVSLRSVMTIQATVFDQSAASRRYEPALAGLLESEAPAGFVIAPEEIVYEAPVERTSSERGVRLEVVAAADATAALDETERRALAEKLAGATPDEAAAILAASPDIATFTIDYAPAWLPEQMPSNAARIEFEVAR